MIESVLPGMHGSMLHSLFKNFTATEIVTKTRFNPFFRGRNQLLSLDTTWLLPASVDTITTAFLWLACHLAWNTIYFFYQHHVVFMIANHHHDIHTKTQFLVLIMSWKSSNSAKRRFSGLASVADSLVWDPPTRSIHGVKDSLWRWIRKTFVKLLFRQVWCSGDAYGCLGHISWVLECSQWMGSIGSTQETDCAYVLAIPGFLI